MSLSWKIPMSQPWISASVEALALSDSLVVTVTRREGDSPREKTVGLLSEKGFRVIPFSRKKTEKDSVLVGVEKVGLFSPENPMQAEVCSAKLECETITTQRPMVSARLDSKDRLISIQSLSDEEFVIAASSGVEEHRMEGSFESLRSFRPRLSQN